MMRARWLLACLAGVGGGCDDGGPTADQQLGDARIMDDMRVDDPDALPDGAVPPDLGVDAGPDDGPPDPDMALDCPVSPAVEGSDALADLTVTAEIAVGSGAAPGQFVVEDLDGAPDGLPEFVVARGGRLEAYNAAGGALWNTPVLAITSIRAVTDVDGDGRRELLAVGGAGAWFFDGLTGAERWRLSATPFRPDDAPIAGVQGTLLADLDGDDLPDLYLTDAGCSGGGNGYGVAISFAGGFDAPVTLGVVAEPRVGGRCARWQTLRDVDGDGRPEVIRPDAQGIDALDSAGGGRVLCGPIADTAGDTRLPHLPLAHPDRPGWMVFDRGRLLRLEARLGEGDCPDGRGTLQVAWSAALGEEVRPDGSAALDVDGDGIDELMTSVLGADGRWQVVLVQADRPRVLVEDALLEGVVDGTPPQLLIRQSPQSAPARFGTLALLALEDPLRPVWPQPIVAAPIRLPATRADRTAEFGPLATVDGAGPVLLIPDPAARAAVALRVVVDGRFVNRPLIGEPGGVRPVCAADGCRADQLAYSTADGRIGVVDAQLALAHGADDRPAVEAPTGLARLTNTTAAGLVATTGDRVARLAIGRTARVDWSVDIGRGRRFDALDPEGDAVIVRDHATSPTTWLALSAAGDALWRHTLDAANHRVLAGGVVAPAEGLVYRFDFVEDVGGWPPDDACPDRADPDIRAPLVDCPDQPATARMVTALDLETGACRWRVTLRPTRCGSPSNQNIARVDDALYVTSTNELIELDAATGAEVARASLGFIGISGRGGGKIVAAGDTLVRFAGNGPLDVHGRDLTLRWRAAPQEIRAQSWLFRTALPVGDAVWISPAARAPIQRYALAAAGDMALPTDQFGLAGGARLEPDAPGSDVRSLQAVADIAPDTDGVLVTTDERWLYALDEAGALAWSRPFDAAIGPPVVADLDGDSRREMALPVGDGRVLIADAAGPAGPDAVWDLPCPAVVTCDPERDIDTTEQTDRLCAEWHAREGVDTYEVRVEDVNGAVLRDWFEVGPNTTVTVQGLSLVPGARYVVRVRGRNGDGPGAPSTSDGVRVVDDPPPQVEITVAPAAIEPQASARITVRARDEELLAGWSLIVEDADGALVQRLGRGPLSQPEFEVSRDWLGDDRSKDPAPPGEYAAVATFTDRAGNVGTARAIITVCGGPCP